MAGQGTSASGAAAGSVAVNVPVTVRAAAGSVAVAGAVAGILAEVLPHHLDRGLPAARRAPEVDGAHPAGAEPGRQPVLAHPLRIIRLQRLSHGRTPPPSP
jgi:hypothetical protein